MVLFEGRPFSEAPGANARGNRAKARGCIYVGVVGEEELAS
jgi:hypothetical protein